MAKKDDMRDRVRSDYADLKERFKDTKVEDFKSGDWFAQYVSWMLTKYSREVDAAYIRRQYPGAAPANQARKAISLAAKYNGIAGGVAAAGVTALELSSIGPQAVVTVPAIGVLIMADVGYSTRTQLRSTYDLSVIHGAPLAMDDVEDCYTVFLTAMGVKLYEMAGGWGKAVGPQIVAYNVRKLLRSGLRRSLQEVLKKVGGTRLARALTERATMRLLVPGVSVPIAYGFNHYFTKQVLNVANKQMHRRGRVVQPLIRAYKRDPAISKTAALKILISIIDAGEPEGWSDAQMDALRYCQGTLSLTDDDLSELDEYFDREIDSVLDELPTLAPKAVNDLVELVTVSSACFPDNRYDEGYAESISKLAARSSKKRTAQTIHSDIKKQRKKLL